MFKNFLLKKMMASQLKDVPAEQQDKLFTALEKNPDLFKKIAEEVQSHMGNGKDKMAATMDVMQKYQEELAEAFK